MPKRRVKRQAKKSVKPRRPKETKAKATECFGHDCTEDAKYRCSYCGREFCQRHIRPFMPQVGVGPMRFVHADGLTKYDREHMSTEYEKYLDWKNIQVVDGHPCVVYAEHRLQGEKEETEKVMETERRFLNQIHPGVEIHSTNSEEAVNQAKIKYESYVMTDKEKEDAAKRVGGTDEASNIKSTPLKSKESKSSGWKIAPLKNGKRYIEYSLGWRVAPLRNGKGRIEYSLNQKAFSIHDGGLIYCGTMKTSNELLALVESKADKSKSKPIPPVTQKDIEDLQTRLLGHKLEKPGSKPKKKFWDRLKEIFGTE